MVSDKTSLYRESMNEGHSLARSAKWADAVRAYRAALNVVPNDVTARTCLALSLYYGGWLSEALKEYGSLHKLSPKDTLILTRIADIQRKLGRIDIAVDLRLQVAELHLQQKQHDKAVEIWRRAEEECGDNIDCLQRLKRAYAKAGEKAREANAELAIAYAYAQVANQDQAVRACRRALELDRSNERASAILRSLENGTSDWRSAGLAKKTVPDAPTKGASAPAWSPRPDGSASPSRGSAAMPSSTQSDADSPGSGDRKVDKSRGRATVESAETILAEAQKLEAVGDIPGALATLCSALGMTAQVESRGSGLALQHIGRLIADVQGVRLDDLVAMPFEDRRIALTGMINAQQYLSLGLNLAAIDACMAAIERVPEYLPVQMRLAEVYHNEGANDKALDKYSCLIDLFRVRNESDMVAETLARIAMLRPQDQDVRGELISLLLAHGDVTVAVDKLSSLAQASIAAGNKTLALELFEKMIDLAPNRIDIRLQYAKVAHDLGRVSEAKAIYEQIWELDPGNFEASWRLTLASASGDDWSSPPPFFDTFARGVRDNPDANAIVAEFAKAHSAAPDKKELNLCLGVQLLQLGQLQEAVNYLERAIGGDQHFELRARYHLALALLKTGDTSTSLDHLSTGLSVLRGAAGQGDSAGDASRSSQLQELRLSYLRVLKDVQRERHDFEGIVGTLEEMQTVDPDDETAYVELAQQYFEMNRVEEAVAQLMNLAGRFAASGQRDREVAVYRSIEEKVPDNLSVRKTLFEGYLSLGLAAEAGKELETIVEMELARGVTSEASDDLRRLIGLYRFSDSRRALALRERLTRLLPNDIGLRRELIETYLKMGFSSKALTSATELAQELMAAGRNDDAVEVLRQMLQVDPWNVWALEHVAGLLYDSGRRDESVQYYRRLLSADPRNQIAIQRLAGSGR